MVKPMKVNRRDILKFFGAGTVIAPIVGAAPAARLIEPPAVEIIKPQDLVVIPQKLSDVVRVSVALEFRDGTTRRLQSTGVMWPNGDTAGERIMAQLTFGHGTSPALDTGHLWADLV